MEKKILVAIDGSIYSSNSLDYLIHLFKNNPDMVIELFSVVSAGSTDQNWKLDVDPLRADTPALELRKIKANRYLQDARERLIQNGFTSDQVLTTVVSSAAPFATAIHHQANQGMFDSLLLGRRGMGKVGEIFMGSVSADLINQCHEVPLWILDGKATSSCFLLAVHGTPESLHAADHLAFIIKDMPAATIFLYHSSAAFGSGSPAPAEQFHDQWNQAWCDRYLDLDNNLYIAHTQVLIENGIRPEQIIRLAPHMGLDIGTDLMRQARRNNCGTIIIGRRGRDVDKGLFGGTSDRTTRNAQDMAIWLVG